MRASDKLGRSYAAGEYIVREGETGDCMYVVLEGAAEVVHEGADGEIVRLGTLDAGEFFGEMALFGGETRSASVRALEPVRMLTVDRRTLMSRVHEDPSLAVKMLESMSARIRALNAVVEAQADDEG